MMLVKADPSICSSINGVSGKCFECGFHVKQKNWISVLVLLCLVFVNPVTFRSFWFTSANYLIYDSNM